MWIDIIFLLLVLGAIIRGVRRGLVVAVFSVLACLAGLAAAIKLSALVANYGENHTHLSSKWVPILAFLLVFLAVVLIVRWIANLVETVVDFAWMQWLNQLGGAVLYLLLFISVYSVFLFYGSRSGLVSERTIHSSVSYRFVEPWAPAIMNTIGLIIPFFRDVFLQLEEFFSRMPGR